MQKMLIKHCKNNLERLEKNLDNSSEFSRLKYKKITSRKNPALKKYSYITFTFFVTLDNMPKF